MITIKKFSKKTNSGNSSQTTSNGFANITVVNGGGSVNSTRGVYLWGQYHDHTQDIDGDLESIGTIKGNTLQGNNATITGNLSADNIESNTADIDGQLVAGAIRTTYADITTIDNETINSTLVNATTVDADTLQAINATITNLLSENITTDYLTVTKAAHFFKLIIDEIKASQGQIIITPANATLAKVVALENNGGYKCYFRASDEDRKIYQNFEINDQIVCQTFNVAEGVSYNVDNKFYWRLCTNVSQSVEQVTIDGQTVDCHWIILSDTDKESHSNSIPEAGDEIVMLGNRTDTTRQAAITIGAYNNPYLDSTINAPFFIQYDGINNYNLSTHRVNIISNGLNQFKGKYSTNTGDDIEQLIADVGQGVITYVHQAYSNSADGRLNFSKTYFTDALYIGFCSNHTESDATLTYSDYTWARLKGNDGINADSYKLIPIIENAPIDHNSTLGVSLRYNIVHNVGTTVEVITASLNGYYVRFKPHKTVSIINTWTNLSVNTTTPSYTNSDYQYNWWTSNDRVTYLEIELVDSNGTVYDQRIVYAQLAPAATLTITDEITSTVQGCREDIDSNTNAISTLNQQYDEIEATVESHTTSINQNTTAIANLTIRADGISSQVSNYTGVQLINLYGWTKADHTAAVYDEEYQGYDISHSVWDDNDYYDIFSNVIKLKQGEKYVFSFYSEFNPHISVAYSATNQLPVNFNNYVQTVRHYDGDDTYMDNPRIYYTFTATTDAYYVIDASMQDEELESAFFRPQLELGETPSQFDINAQMLSSQIVQTADNIILQVNNCGIDIDNRQITLNGNTLINGNLTLNQAEQGFTLQGIGGTTLISAQSIGTYNQFINRTAIDYIAENVQTSALIKNTITEPSPSTFYFGYFRFTNTIGKVKSGTTITLNNVRYSYMNDGQPITSGVIIETANTNWSVYEDGVYKQTITFTNGVATYTTTSDSIISIQNYAVIRFYIINNEEKVVEATLNYHVNVPINDSFTLIGYDGIGSNFGNNKTVYIGAEGTYIKYGNAGFKVTDNVIKKMNPNGDWVGLDAKNVKVMSDSNYTITDDDELIIANNSMTSDRYLDLPSSTYAGRTIYVKDYSHKTINVRCNNKIIPSNGYSPQSTASVNNTANMFIYDGNYWLQFYCG